MEQYFKMDNTEGYTQEQLDEMNRMANERITNREDYEEIQQVCEKVQKKYDNR